MLYTLNLYRDVSQLFLNKTEKIAKKREKSYVYSIHSISQRGKRFLILLNKIRSKRKKKENVLQCDLYIIFSDMLSLYQNILKLQNILVMTSHSRYAECISVCPNTCSVVRFCLLSVPPPSHQEKFKDRKCTAQWNVLIAHGLRPQFTPHGFSSYAFKKESTVYGDTK